VMWYHVVWQMCTDVLWDDPVQCDVMKEGRRVQMFCEMTLCNVMSGRKADVYRCFVRWPCAMWCQAGRQMCTDVLWDDPVQCDVMQYCNVYRCFVRTCCRVEMAHCSRLKSSGLFQQHLCENLTAIRLYLTHSDWDINSSTNTLSYPQQYTVLLYIYSECHTWVGSFRNVAVCMAICTCIQLKLQGVKFQTFSHWWCWWVKSSGPCHNVVP